MVTVNMIGTCKLPKDIDFTKFDRSKLPSLNQKILTLQH